MKNPRLVPPLIRSGLRTLLIAGGCFLMIAFRSFAGSLEGETAVRRSVLANGLTVVTQTDASSTVTVVEILIKGGSRAEQADRKGASYLATRLAMDIQDESTARNFMVKALQSSMTSRDDDAVIHLECLTEFVDEALASFLKILKDPLFTSLRLDRLTESMNHQRRIQADDAGNECRLAQREAFFAGTGYAGSIFGTEKSLGSLKPRDLKNFYERQFVAGNMIVAAVSDLPADALFALIERHFAKIRPGQAPAPDSPFVPQNPPYPTRTIVKGQQQSVVSCGYLLPPISRRDYVLIALIENMLGRGPGSRLWSLRTEKKLSYQVSALASSSREAGLLEAYLETEADKTDSAREDLASALTEFWRNGVSPEEFSAGRAVLRADFLRANETKAYRVSTLGFFESSGLGAEFFGQFSAELSSLTLDEVNAEIKRLLDPARASWVIVGPKFHSS
ncbi:MAG: pitrilysin family protein [Candidatus Aminicenantes bacterium]|nr:pitrilysin family protein [Candidatus Aminicenantes bacterium]